MVYLRFSEVAAMSKSIVVGTPLFEVSKLLRHASIQMTERYAHLAPDHLQNAVDNLGFSARFQHTKF